MTVVTRELFVAHERYLFGLCYRMTGSASDADDLVQQTFERAIASPPPRTDEPWRPWLTRVAINLARDQLRRRKTRGYDGTWLPSPVELDSAEELAPAHEPHATDGRYDLLESVSFAFLVALEALTPKQRAVLILRDVFDYSVQETASALDLSEANVKTTHHRARAAMETYDAGRAPKTTELRERTRRTLEEFLSCLVRDDVPGVERLLSESVRAISDGGGEYLAARVPVVGREKVARFFLKLTRRNDPHMRVALRMINGEPAVVAEYPSARGTEAPRVVLRIDLDRDGRIAWIHSVLASAKLTAVRRA